MPTRCERKDRSIKNLQHRLDLSCLLEVSTSLRSDFVDSNTIRKLNERQTFCEVNIEYTLLCR